MCVKQVPNSVKCHSYWGGLSVSAETQPQPVTGSCPNEPRAITHLFVMLWRPEYRLRLAGSGALSLALR